MSINPMQRVVVRVNCPPDITASQSPNELSQLDSFLGPHAVTIISIPLALRRAATSTMHPANPPAFYRGGLIHGVVLAHFVCDPPTVTGTASFCVGSRISMGFSVSSIRDRIVPAPEIYRTAHMEQIRWTYQSR
jgi:hypothetical protein